MESAVLKMLSNYGYDEDIDETVNVDEAGSQTKFDQTYFEKMLLTLKKDELKAEARKCHLPITGNKIDLVQILSYCSTLSFDFWYILHKPQNHLYNDSNI